MTVDLHNNKVYVFGQGGHAKVIAELIKHSTEFELGGFIDINQENQFIRDALDGTHIVIGIGENAVRARCAQKLGVRNFQYPNLIHPSSIIATDVKMGHGNIFMAGSIINNGAAIGDFCVFNTASILEHDCKVESYVSLAPAAVVCGDCKLAKGSYVGANATLIHGLEMLEWSVLGAGGVATNSIEENSIHAGNPACRIKSKQTEDSIL